ncbi:hypothetical protein cd3_089 [Carnobacterium phage cd3]|uniref:Uncharacterized protein n=1 Tax=Carnobacterium phage cd2 TaxID=2849244 RepID=A0AAE7SNV3_9CAUD|nr:hypothetical protein PQD68_gp089 [Carnobacterium phage cd2]QXP45215.1 hypothetical protein cd2_089 [Carnobacterium phage cd2]QXP45230.1 hypothetical protein cd3_089 [Carnobacterium phage cd3]
MVALYFLNTILLILLATAFTAYVELNGNRNGKKVRNFKPIMGKVSRKNSVKINVHNFKIRKVTKEQLELLNVISDKGLLSEIEYEQFTLEMLEIALQRKKLKVSKMQELLTETMEDF